MRKMKKLIGLLFFVGLTGCEYANFQIAEFSEKEFLSVIPFLMFDGCPQAFEGGQYVCDITTNVNPVARANREKAGSKKKPYSFQVASDNQCRWAGLDDGMLNGIPEEGSAGICKISLVLHRESQVLQDISMDFSISPKPITSDGGGNVRIVDGDEITEELPEPAAPPVPPVRDSLVEKNGLALDFVKSPYFSYPSDPSNFYMTKTASGNYSLYLQSRNSKTDGPYQILLDSKGKLLKKADLSRATGSHGNYLKMYVNNAHAHGDEVIILGTSTARNVSYQSEQKKKCTKTTPLVQFFDSPSTGLFCASGFPFKDYTVKNSNNSMSFYTLVSNCTLTNKVFHEKAKMNLYSYTCKGLDGKTYYAGSDDNTLPYAVGSAGKYVYSAAVPEMKMISFKADGSVKQTKVLDSEFTKATGSPVKGHISTTVADYKSGAGKLINRIYLGNYLESGQYTVPKQRPQKAYMVEVVALKPDGSLDTTYGINGISRFSHDDYENLMTEGLQLGGDGYLYVYAKGHRVDPNKPNGPYNRLVILRLDKNGQVDKAFGKNGALELTQLNWSGNGEDVRFHQDSPNNNYIYKLAGEKVYIFKFDDQGVLNKNFGNKGYKVSHLNLLVKANGAVAFEKSYEELRAGSIDIQRNGKLLVTATINTNNWIKNNHTYVLRVNLDGALDESFGHKGALQTAHKRKKEIHVIDDDFFVHSMWYGSGRTVDHYLKGYQQ